VNPTQGGWVILTSFLVALVLSIVHLPEGWPEWFSWLRPSWLVLVLFFWAIEVPHRIGMITMWIVGLFVDVLLAQPLGLNGFILASVTYVAWQFFERLRMYSVFQQCGVLFILVLAAEVLRELVLGLGSSRVWNWWVFLVATMTSMAWPFVYLLLVRIRTGMRIE